MSFEYEVRPRSGALDARSRDALKKAALELGGVATGDGSPVIFSGCSRADEVVAYPNAGGLLIVINSPAMLRSPIVRALRSGGRALGLDLYEEGEDTPVDV